MCGELWVPTGDKSKEEHQEGWTPKACKQDKAVGSQG